MRTHLAIFLTDRDVVAVLTDGLALLAIGSNDRKKSWEGDTWRMPANLADI